MRVINVQLGESLAGKLSFKLSSTLSSDCLGLRSTDARPRLRRFAARSFRFPVVASRVM
jgi:hypothetical protein